MEGREGRTAPHLCKAEGAGQQRGVSLHPHHMEAPAAGGGMPCISWAAAGTTSYSTFKKTHTWACWQTSPGPYPDPSSHKIMPCTVTNSGFELGPTCAPAPRRPAPRRRWRCQHRWGGRGGGAGSGTRSFPTALRGRCSCGPGRGSAGRQAGEGGVGSSGECCGGPASWVALPACPACPSVHRTYTGSAR